MERRKRRPQKSVSDTCPKCGYCDKCGRSNAAPVWPYPYVYPNVAPYIPWVPPMTWPYTITTGGATQSNAQTLGLTSITVRGTSSAAAQPAYNPSVYNISGLPFNTNGN